MNNVEYLDIFDKNEKPLGVKTREECHAAGVDFYHRAVWCWLVNDKNEILIQQRALTKKNRGGCWEELSVAGHVLSGEEPKAACQREINEELGIKNQPLIFLEKWLCEDHEIVYFYFGKVNCSINELTLQDEEVASAKFIDFRLFEQMLNDNVFGDYPEYYKKLVKSLLSKCLK